MNVVLNLFNFFSDFFRTFLLSPLNVRKGKRDEISDAQGVDTRAEKTGRGMRPLFTEK